MAMALDELADAGLIDAGGRGARPVAPDIAALGERLRAETARRAALSTGGPVLLRAFAGRSPRSRCSSSGRTRTRRRAPDRPVVRRRRARAALPRSLAEHLPELAADLGIPRAPHGDLSAWSDQGVMLLNRVLTVAPGAPASHRGWGWEKVTEHAIRTLVARDRRSSRSSGGGMPRTCAPSRHDADRSPPTVAAVGEPRLLRVPAVLARQRLLEQQGATPVDWRLG
jgi:uracil-DNA glycosylase